MTDRATALIAEDEPLLLDTLRRRLASAWPSLAIVAEAGDGLSATALALQHRPDVMFLDIRMPARNGLDVAEAVVDDWPDDIPPPLVVFVTAYDEYALQAFERAAFDYIQKPASVERLALTVSRLQARLAERATASSPNQAAALLARLGGLAGMLNQPATVGTTDWDVLHIGVGNMVRIVRLDEVLYFEAADKYTNVVTRAGEGLIRQPLRELLAWPGGRQFMQVHRCYAVNRGAIASATRHEGGTMTLQLRDTPRAVPVSRAYAGLFKAM